MSSARIAEAERYEKQQVAWRERIRRCPEAWDEQKYWREAEEHERRVLQFQEDARHDTNLEFWENEKRKRDDDDHMLNIARRQWTYALFLSDTARFEAECQRQSKGQKIGRFHFLPTDIPPWSERAQWQS